MDSPERRETFRCPRCGTVNHRSRRVCTRCGYLLRGDENGPDALPIGASSGTALAEGVPERKGWDAARLGGSTAASLGLFALLWLASCFRLPSSTLDSGVALLLWGPLLLLCALAIGVPLARWATDRGVRSAGIVGAILAALVLLLTLTGPCAALSLSGFSARLGLMACKPARALHLPYARRRAAALLVLRGEAHLATARAELREADRRRSASELPGLLDALLWAPEEDRARRAARQAGRDFREALRLDPNSQRADEGLAEAAELMARRYETIRPPVEDATVPASPAPSAGTAARPAPSHPSPPSTRTTPSPPPGRWTRVMQVSGRGSKNTQSFTVSSEWAIQWQHSGDGYFAVIVKDSGDHWHDLVAGIIGPGSDTSYEHGWGTYHLEVVGDQWAITVWDKP